MWLVKSKEYSDRNKKDLHILNSNPSADRNIVAKKINALHTVYKKELLKVHGIIPLRAGLEMAVEYSMTFKLLQVFLNSFNNFK